MALRGSLLLTLRNGGVVLVVTARDIKVLEFMAQWRFVTQEQLIKASVFQSKPKTCYKRLLALRRGKLINAGLLGNGRLYYYLAVRGGEEAGLNVPWYSKMYRNAGLDVVLKHLVACDFALALGIEYLPRREVLDRWMAADYDVLARCFRGADLFFKKDGVLHVLVIDYQYSLKYLAERVRLYSRLQPDIREQLVVDFLVFSEARQKENAEICLKFVKKFLWCS